MELSWLVFICLDVKFAERKGGQQIVYKRDDMHPKFALALCYYYVNSLKINIVIITERDERNSFESLASPSVYSVVKEQRWWDCFLLFEMFKSDSLEPFLKRCNSFARGGKSPLFNDCFAAFFRNRFGFKIIQLHYLQCHLKRNNWDFRLEITGWWYRSIIAAFSRVDFNLFRIC